MAAHRWRVASMAWFEAAQTGDGAGRAQLGHSAGPVWKRKTRHQPEPCIHRSLGPSGQPMRPCYGLIACAAACWAELVAYAPQPLQFLDCPDDIGGRHMRLPLVLALGLLGDEHI